MWSERGSSMRRRCRCTGREQARLGEANVLTSLGDLESRLGNVERAREQYEAALPLYRQQQDRLGEANVYLAFADMFLGQRQWVEAGVYYEQALPLFVAEQEPLGQANTLMGLGLVRFELGEHERGIQDVQQAAEALPPRTRQRVGISRPSCGLLELRMRHELPEVDVPRLLARYLAVQSSQEMFQLVQQEPVLLTVLWITQAEMFVNSPGDDQRKAAFNERLETLKQIKQILEQGAVEVSEVTKIIIEFANANWSDRYQLLTDRSDILLNKGIEPLFEALLVSIEDPDEQQFLEKMRLLLRRCRTWGVQPVFYFELQMRLGDSVDIPAQCEFTVMQVAKLLVERAEGTAALEHAVEIMGALLNDLPADVSPLFKTALLRDLAETMYALPADHLSRDLLRIEAYYREALPVYREADRPTSVAYIQRSIGDVLFEQGRYDEALEPLQTAAETLQSEDRIEDAVWALSSFASALDYAGRAEESLIAYGQAISLLPDSPLLLRNRAEALIHAGRLDEAEADLTHAVELDGNEDSPYLWWRRAQLAIARGEGTLADQFLDEMVKHDPSTDDNDVLFSRAQSAWLRGELDVAQEKLRLALEGTNPGQQAAMHRELQRLYAAHPELPAIVELG